MSEHGKRSQPLPAMRQSFPNACRVRVGEFANGRPTKRLHFDIADERPREGSMEVRYHTHRGLMEALAVENGDAGKGPIEKYKPRRIPIELLSDDPTDFLRIRISRWRKSGPECTSDGFRAMTLDEIAAGNIQNALGLQGLPTNPDAADIADMPELWVGNCITYHYENDEGGFPRCTHKTTGQCYPLLCEHFRPAQASQGQCKPEVEFRFRLPWAGQRSWASFKSTSWATASKLMTTLADLHDNMGGRLRGLQCLLVTQPERRRTPNGKKALQPVVYIATDRPMRELRAQASEALALEQGTPLALPTMDEVAEDPKQAEAFTAEFHPEIPTSEGAYYTWAEEQGHTYAKAEGTLAECGGDVDAATTALMAENGGVG